MLHVLYITSEDLDNIVHGLTKIAHCIAGVDTTEGSKRLLHSCEMELVNIRQTLIESVEDN